jgi:predicted DsbA family dithiol-disulfide isomerase
MHDRLFAHRRRLSSADLFRYASELGLDLGRFEDDLRRRVHAARVAEDVRSADASGVAGTPTFFVDGRRHRDVHEVAALTRAIRNASAGRA